MSKDARSLGHSSYTLPKKLLKGAKVGISGFRMCHIMLPYIIPSIVPYIGHAASRIPWLSEECEL